MGEYQTLDQYFITNTLTRVIKSKIIQPKNEVGIKKHRMTLPGGIRFQVAMGLVRKTVLGAKFQNDTNKERYQIPDTRLLSH